jgi:hypothetical protein
MVKKLFAFVGYILFFMTALLFFLPKVQLFYLLEETLKKQEILLVAEQATDSGFSLRLETLHVTLKGVDSLLVTETEVSLFGIYNKITANKIKLSSALQSFLPLDIEHVEVFYTPLNPFIIQASAQGAFGEALCTYKLIEGEATLHLVASDKMQKNYARTLRELKKDANGEYDYAKKF